MRLVAEHAALRDALGAVPSQWACYRFAAKLREHSAALADCLDRVTDGLHKLMPGMGEHVALDGSDLPAYANGQRFVRKGGPERERYADPDASWGHRSAISTRKGGGFYGYKVHAAVCTRTGLPLAWTVESARHVEQTFATALLDAAQARGFRPLTAAMDSAYDTGPVHDGFEARGCHPVVKLRKDAAVKNGWHRPPTCEHGTWTFAGADYKRGASKWRCPTGECKPASRWVKASRLHPLIPRETSRWGKLYAQRSAVEREFGRLKHEWASPAPRPRNRARPAARRLDDPRPACPHARPCAGGGRREGRAPSGPARRRVARKRTRRRPISFAQAGDGASPKWQQPYMSLPTT